jgi:hypothetical protein
MAAVTGSALQVVAGLTMIATLFVAAVFVGRYEAAAAIQKAAEPAPAAAPAEPAPSAGAAAGDFREITASADAVAAQIKQLRALVDNFPTPAPPPDIHSLQEKLDCVAASVSAAMPLVSQVGKLGERLGGIEKQVEGFGADILAIKQMTGAAGRNSAR